MKKPKNCIGLKQAIMGLLFLGIFYLALVQLANISSQKAYDQGYKSGWHDGTRAQVITGEGQIQFSPGNFSTNQTWAIIADNNNTFPSENATFGKDLIIYNYYENALYQNGQKVK